MRPQLPALALVLALVRTATPLSDEGRLSTRWDEALHARGVSKAPGPHQLEAGSTSTPSASGGEHPLGPRKNRSHTKGKGITGTTPGRNLVEHKEKPKRSGRKPGSKNKKPRLRWWQKPLTAGAPTGRSPGPPRPSSIRFPFPDPPSQPWPNIQPTTQGPPPFRLFGVSLFTHPTGTVEQVSVQQPTRVEGPIRPTPRRPEPTPRPASYRPFQEASSSHQAPSPTSRSGTP